MGEVSAFIVKTDPREPVSSIPPLSQRMNLLQTVALLHVALELPSL